MRRYIGLDILAKSRLTIAENTEPEEVTLTAYAVPFAHQVTYSEHSFALGRPGPPGESCPEVGGALTQASAASPSPGLASDADVRRAGADELQRHRCTAGVALAGARRPGANDRARERRSRTWCRAPIGGRRSRWR